MTKDILVYFVTFTTDAVKYWELSKGASINSAVLFLEFFTPPPTVVLGLTLWNHMVFPYTPKNRWS